jgi:hypothetical protein
MWREAAEPGAGRRRPATGYAELENSWNAKKPGKFLDLIVWKAARRQNTGDCLRE